MLLGRKDLGRTVGGRETSGAAAPGIQARDRCSEQVQKTEVDLLVLGIGCERGRERKGRDTHFTSVAWASRKQWAERT